MSEILGSRGIIESSLLQHFEIHLALSYPEACPSVAMERQKQGCHRKRSVDTACQTKVRKRWTAHRGTVVYGINAEKDVDNQVESALNLDGGNVVAARSHHRSPAEDTKAKEKPPSLTARRSPCTESKDGRQTDMLIPSCEHFNEHLRTALKYAVSHPPVTTATLIELNLNWILHNINLRSDINFEDDLHFMPVKGKRAEQKRTEAREYWLALAAELQIHSHTRLECCVPDRSEEGRVQDRFSPRLPQMFAELRELLETLVPDRDHVSIAGNLDVPFLMQQIENGVLDISQLAKWLASLLKNHCAPMRDEWADQMTQQIEEGFRKSDMTLLVSGIEKLFSVLEAMKLDVANHQIRTFRFQLMEDTIPFQQRFFAKKIMDGKIHSRPCRDWYDEARQRYNSWLLCSSSATNLDGYANLIHGIINTLCLDSNIGVLPKSFHYDLKRLEIVRSDLQDLAYLKMCVVVFDELRFWLTSGCPNTVSSATYAKLQSRVLAIVDEQPDDADPWKTSSADVALEITRAACISCGYSEVSIPNCVIECTCHRLCEFFCRQTSECTLLWGPLQEELTVRAIHHAQIFNEMTPLAMSQAQQQWQQQHEQKTSFRPLPNIEDIARRLAHVGILHWKVWAKLTYLDDVGNATPEMPKLVSPVSDRQTEEGRRKISTISSSMEMLVE